MRYNALLVATLISIGAPMLTHAAGFQNPLASRLTQELLQGFITSIIYVGMPVIVVLIVIVGFRFVLAQGNAEKLVINRGFALKVFAVTTLFLALWAITRTFGATIGALSLGIVFVVVAFVFYLIFFLQEK